MHAQPETIGRSPVPRVTLYVKDSDAPIWDRARALVSTDENSLSAFVTEALETLVVKRERQQQAGDTLDAQLESIEISGVDWFNDERPKRVRFKGALAHESGQATYYVTKGKQVVVEFAHPTGKDRIRVFESFDEFKEASDGDPETIQAVADAIGEDYFEEID